MGHRCWKAAWINLSRLSWPTSRSRMVFAAWRAAAFSNSAPVGEWNHILLKGLWEYSWYGDIDDRWWLVDDEFGDCTSIYVLGIVTIHEQILLTNPQKVIKVWHNGLIGEKDGITKAQRDNSNVEWIVQSSSTKPLGVFSYLKIHLFLATSDRWASPKEYRAWWLPCEGWLSGAFTWLLLQGECWHFWWVVSFLQMHFPYCNCIMYTLWDAWSVYNIYEYVFI